MTRAKTTAQWRREVPAYDKAIRAVESAVKAWPGGPRMIAHVHPDTRVVSLILDGTEADCEHADRLLAYRSGWAWDTTYGHPVWRKTVTR
jgi:hypothetical protein